MKSKDHNQTQDQKIPKETQPAQTESRNPENSQQERASKLWQKGMPLPDVRSLDPEDAEKLVEKLEVKDALDFIENAQPKLKYNLILASPFASKIVERLSFEEIYFIVKEIDETTSLELFELTTPEQFEGFLDLECWSKDRPNLLRINKWMSILMAMDDDQFFTRITQIDKVFLVGYLKKYLEVFKGEVSHEHFQPDELTLFLSQDLRYLVRFRQKTSENPFIYELLNRIYRLDWQFFYELTEGIYWELETDLEEEAYENKVKRLLDWGFPEYYEALDIFAYRDPKQFNPTPKVESSFTESEEELIEPPSFPMLFAPTDSLFLRAIKLLDERKHKEVQWETVYLANRYIVAESLDFSRVEEVFKSLTELHRIISIALEFFAGDNPKLAADALANFYLKDIFIKGYSLILEKKAMARDLLELLKRWQPDVPASLFDSPYAEFLEEIMLTRPRFFVGIFERTKGESREFANLKEIRAAESTIKSLEALALVFEHLFPPAQTNLKVLANASTNVKEPTEIKFSTLFLTGLANRFLGRDFKAEPIPKSELKNLVVSTIVSSGQRPSIKKKFHAEFFNQLSEFIKTLDKEKRRQRSIQKAVKPLFLEFLNKYLEELGNIANLNDIDPRFISCLFVGM